MPPTATPKAATPSHCCRVKRWIFGRTITISTAAARPRRSAVVPQEPIAGKSCVARAAPNWSEMHEPRMNRIGVIGTPPEWAPPPTPAVAVVEEVVTAPLCPRGPAGSSECSRRVP